MPGLSSGGAPSEVIPKPKGDKGAKNTTGYATTSSYATVTGAEYTITKDKTFHLAKLVVSCDQDVLVKLRFDGTDQTIEYYVSGKLPTEFWYAWGEKSFLGDGTKKIDVQAKYPTGGATGTLWVEFRGEEV